MASSALVKSTTWADEPVEKNIVGQTCLIKGLVGSKQYNGFIGKINKEILEGTEIRYSVEFMFEEKLISINILPKNFDIIIDLPKTTVSTLSTASKSLAIPYKQFVPNSIATRTARSYDELSENELEEQFYSGECEKEDGEFAVNLALENSALYEQIEKMHQENTKLEDLVAILENDVEANSATISELSETNEQITKDRDYLYDCHSGLLEAFNSQVAELNKQDAMIVEKDAKILEQEKMIADLMAKLQMLTSPQ